MKSDSVKGVLLWIAVGVLLIAIPVLIANSGIGMDKIEYGKRLQTTPEPTEVVWKFVLNTSSKKIHTADCGLVKRMSDENKKSATEEEIGSLLDDGYTFCGTCGKKYSQNTR